MSLPNFPILFFNMTDYGSLVYVLTISKMIDPLRWQFTSLKFFAYLS